MFLIYSYFIENANAQKFEEDIPAVLWQDLRKVTRKGSYVNVDFYYFIKNANAPKFEDDIT